MKDLRHSLGRWLLRDEGNVARRLEFARMQALDDVRSDRLKFRVVADDPGAARASDEIIRAIRKHKRGNGEASAV